MRSRSRCSGAYEETFIRAAEQARPGAGWKAIVKTYLRPEFCEHPERGCPLAALAPELARADKRMKPQIVAELVNYKNQMLPFMPGRRTVDIKTTWSKSRLFVEVTPWQEGILSSSRVTGNPEVIGSSAGLVPRNAPVFIDNVRRGVPLDNCPSHQQTNFPK